MTIRCVLTLILFCLLTPGNATDYRLFRSADGSKSFAGELTAYNPKTKVVSVRIKNGRIQKFSIDVLSEDDQKYVKENAMRLAAGNNLDLTLESFKNTSRKESKDRITDRIYPSGYTIKIRNRSKQTMEGVTLNYTLHYQVQDYLEPERESHEVTGSLECGTIVPLASFTLQTETVDIISGKLEPVITNMQRRGPGGEDYIEPVVTKPGGKRKDLLVGCRVDVIVDGKVVKTVIDGTLAVEAESR